MQKLVPGNRMLKAKGLVLCMALAFAPLCAHAEGAAAPGMFDVEEVIVQFTHFGNEKIAQGCGLTAQDLSTALIKALTANGVPAVSVADAKPPILGTARIDLIPEIYTMNNLGLDCTSWVSLFAQTHNAVHVPPVDVARNVTVVYWRDGSLLSGDQTTHARMVSDTLQKLGRHFAEQYKLDQPASSAN